MPSWVRRGGWGLLLWLWMGGCSPMAEGPLDEQKDPYFRAGKERLEARDYKAAIEAFEKTLELNPHSALAHYELGVLYEQHEQDYASAIYHYNRAIKLRPNGYPADNARLLIAGCRQELVKAESLAPVAQSVLREVERLRQENQQLRRQLEAWQAYYQRQKHASASQPRGSSAAFVPIGRPGSANRTEQTSAQDSAGKGQAATRAAGPAATSARAHRVKPGETLASISRQYAVRLPALMAANPNVDARRLQVGQTVNIPTP